MSIQTLSELFLGISVRDRPDFMQRKIDGVRRLSSVLDHSGVQCGDRSALRAVTLGDRRKVSSDLLAPVLENLEPGAESLGLAGNP